MRVIASITPAITAVLVLVCCFSAHADDRPYTEGSVWDITMVRTAYGLADDYLESQGKFFKPMYDEAQKQGLVLSYKFFSFPAVGADDWDILIMVEYKNWAAFDGLSEKFESISRKDMTKDAEHDLMVKRLDIRRIVGTKIGQELILK